MEGSSKTSGFLRTFGKWPRDHCLLLVVTLRRFAAQPATAVEPGTAAGEYTSAIRSVTVVRQQMDLSDTIRCILGFIQGTMLAENSQH